MVRTRFIRISVFIVALVVGPQSAEASQTAPPEKQSAPIDRGFGQHDACFGDKYESDDDLKTGNEISIEEVLKLLNQPGT
jgi:hypothetical protein